MKQSKKMFFIHHLIRPIWARPIEFIYFLIYGFYFLFSEKAQIKYYEKKKEFYSNKTLTDMSKYYQKNYNYKFDGFGKFVEWLKKQQVYYLTEKKRSNKLLSILIKIFSAIRGILDHDNPKVEYFLSGYDCDDCEYIKEALEDEYDIIKIGMIESKIQTYHYDCIIEIQNYIGNKYILFNYGNLIYGDSIQDCLKQLCKEYNWDPNDLKWWKCKY